MTKKPSYRFTGYTEVWEEKKLGNLGSVEMCRRIFKEETSAEFEIPFFKIGTFGGEADTYITREKFEEYKTKFAYPQRGDLLLSASGSIGRVVEYDGDEAYYQDSNIVWLNHHGKINNKFLKAFYKIVSWSGIEGTTIKRLYNKNILETDISLPSLSEQTAIGSFFQDIDQLISLQQRKLEVLKEQKKTYLKLLFSAKGQTKPALRFAGFEDEWKEVKLGEVTERITRKNKHLESTLPLTISAQYGLIDQETFFNKKVASKDVSGYYLLKRGEFAYNKSYSSEYPWGAVKRLDNYEKGILSPLYIVFKPKFIDSDFLAVYYASSNWHKEVSMRASEGARNHGLLNISPQDFFDTELIVPISSAEQEAIGSFFQDLDKAIAKQEEKVNQLKESKQTLLRKMFI